MWLSVPVRTAARIVVGCYLLGASLSRFSDHRYGAGSVTLAMSALVIVALHERMPGRDVPAVG